MVSTITASRPFPPLQRLREKRRRFDDETLVDAGEAHAPLIAGLDGARRSRSEAVLERWLQAPDPWLRRSAGLVREAIATVSGEVPGR